MKKNQKQYNKCVYIYIYHIRERQDSKNKFEIKLFCQHFEFCHFQSFVTWVGSTNQKSKRQTKAKTWQRTKKKKKRKRQTGRVWDEANKKKRKKKKKKMGRPLRWLGLSFRWSTQVMTCCADEFVSLGIFSFFFFFFLLKIGIGQNWLKFARTAKMT